jgi:hypothetical protein
MNKNYIIVGIIIIGSICGGYGLFLMNDKANATVITNNIDSNNTMDLIQVLVTTKDQKQFTIDDIVIDPIIHSGNTTSFNLKHGFLANNPQGNIVTDLNDTIRNGTGIHLVIDQATPVCINVIMFTNGSMVPLYDSAIINNPIPKPNSLCTQTPIQKIISWNLQ